LFFVFDGGVAAITVDLCPIFCLVVRFNRLVLAFDALIENAEVEILHFE